MNAQRRQQLVAAGLALAAFAAVAVLYKDRGSMTTDELGKRQGMLVDQWRRADVGEIIVTHGASAFTLHKVDGDFRLREMDDELADTGAAEALLAAFDYARPLRNASDDPSLGFAAPRARVAVKMTHGSFVLELGKAAPGAEGVAYARIDAGKPFVVSSDFAEAMLRPLDTYRDKRIVPYVSAVLGRVEATGPRDVMGDGLVLQRAGDAPFRIPRLSSVRAHRDRLARFWVALVDVRAESFLDAATAPALLGDAGVTLVLTPKEPSTPPAEIRVGGKCGTHGTVAWRVRPRPVVACVPESVLAELRVSDAGMVDRSVTSFHADEIAEVSLTGAHGGDWARVESGFRERTPRDRPLSESESALFRAWLEALVRDESSEVVRNGIIENADKPHDPLTLILRAGTHEESILFEGSRASRSDDAATLRLGAHLANLLAARARMTETPAAFLDGVDGADVTDVTLACDGARAAAHKTNVGYSPPDVSADRLLPLVGSALALSKDPRAAWVSLRDDGTYGFAAPGAACTLHLSWRGGKDVTLAFGGAAPQDRVYVRTSRDEGVFTAPAALRAAVARGLSPRDGGSADAGDAGATGR